MNLFLQVSNHILFFYYFLSNLVYLGLLVVAIAASVAQQRRLGTLWLERLRVSPLAPPISILVPARNEEKTIVDSVRSLLALDYPELEVIVANDGSNDGTLDELTRHFDLILTDILYVSEIPTQTVRGIYMSKTDRRLLVLDKESSGHKADALNAALNAASSPYVCAVDADAILEKDALLRIMAPVLNNPGRVVATGGIVRVINGSSVQGGVVREVRLPRRLLEVLQAIEYLRAFLVGRQGWAQFNSLLIISGAFGVFRRDLCKQIGGFRGSAVGEDLDLVVRMHRRLRDLGEDYHISFVPDPVCWTEVPSTTKILARQRARWQKGLIDVLWQNRGMLFNPRYGRIGFLALPYHWVFECIAPLVEVVGWTTMTMAAFLGMLSREFFVEFLLFGYIFSTMISIGSVVIEEMTYHRYNDWRDLARLIGVCFLEFFPYRQLNTLWRVRGMWQHLFGNSVWGKMDRIGFTRPLANLESQAKRPKEKPYS
ncbi:MAG: glycosyl transferase [Acidobacteria bacterium]|nr:MAG: glycosyl transferase [Acidobacteriota bacterium]